jgi:hypothetical protein
VTWREDARAESEGLKPYFVQKYGWAPRSAEPDGQDALDLYVTLTSKRLDGQVFMVRLRYLPDWQVAGRRETFVNPQTADEEGTAHWPPQGVPSINPQHDPPVICLRGVWGYHSVLHADRPMGDSTLLTFLLELQRVLDE